VSGGNTTFSISGITNDKSYDVQVMASNDTFSSGWSTTGTVDGTRAQAPTLTPLTSSRTLTLSQSSITLTATASAVNGESLTYRWYRASDTTTTLSSSSSLSISGPIALSQTDTYTVQVTASILGTTASSSSSIRINVANKPIVDSSIAVTTGTAGASYSHTMSGSLGLAPYTWALSGSSTLPAGLTMTSGGVISGTLSDSATTTTVTFAITDSNGVTNTSTATFTIASSIGIATSTLGNGTPSRSYSATLTASGGKTPYVWSTTASDLPSGLSLSSSGTISGTLASGATSKTFTATVTDANGATDSKRLTITMASGIPGTAIIDTVTATSSGTLSVTFRIPTDDSTTAISSYVIIYKKVAGGEYDDDDSEQGSISYNPAGQTSPYTTTITGLKNGRNYQVSVSAKNAAGTGASSSVITVSPKGTPSVPRSITAALGDGGISLRWSKPEENGGSESITYSAQCRASTETDADYKDVDLTGNSRGDDDSYKKAITGYKSGTQFVVGTAYICRVKSTSRGVDSAWSAPTSSLTYATRPGKPTSFTVTNTAVKGKVTVTWGAPASNGGRAISNYIVSLDKTGHENDEENDDRRSCSTNGTTYTCDVTGVPSKGTFSLSIKAVNSLGAGATESTSVTIAGKTQTLTTPSVSSKSVGDPDFSIGATVDSGLKLKYSVPETSTVCSITEKGLVRLKGPGTCTVSITQNGYVDDDEHGDDSEWEPLSGSHTVTFSVAALRPNTPTIKSVTPGNGQLVVIVQSSSSGGTPTGIDAQTSLDVSPRSWSSSTSDSSTTITLTGLTNGTKYRIQVRATNSGGNSSWVEGSTTYIPATTPGQPTSVSATANSSSSSIAVSWSAPASNGGSAITGYTVTATASGISPNPSCSTGGATYSCTLTSLTNKLTYTISVTARNAIGSGSPSSTTTATLSGLSQSISLTETPSVTGWLVGDPNVQLKAKATSGLAVQYSSTTPTICTVSTGGSVSLVSVGTCKIALAQDGSGSNYSAAPTPSFSPIQLVITNAPPSAPSITSITNGESGLTVNWSAPSRLGGGVDTYTVTATAGGVNKTCTSTSALTCPLTTLDKGTEYSITVVAANSTGNSPASANRNGTWLTIPSIPLSFTATASATNGRSVSTNWTKSADNGGAAILRYVVTATSGSLPTVTCTVNSDTSTTFACPLNGLRAGATYSITVYAVNSIGNSLPASASATPGLVQTITASTPLTKNFGTPDFSLGASIDSGRSLTYSSSDETKCKVSTFGMVHLVYAGSCTVTITQAGPSDSDETEYKLSTKSVVITINAVTPGTPVISSVVPDLDGSDPSKGQISIDWSDPDFDGGAATTDSATAYSGSSYFYCTPSSGATSCTITGLTLNTTYTVYVGRSNSAGSVSSATQTSRPVSIGSGVPAPVTATGDIRQSNVTWTVPLSPPNTQTYYYQIQYKSTSSSTYALWPTTFDSATTSATITSLSNNTSYHFQVRTNDPTAGAGTWSETVTATTLALPGTPQALSVNAGYSGTPNLTVNFLPPSNDGGSPITSYVVTASPSISSTCSPGTSTTCTYSSVTAGTLYTISVHAVTDVGSGNDAQTSVTAVNVPQAAPGTISAVGNSASDSATITWNAISDSNNGGLTISSYTVVAYAAGVATALTCTVANNSSPTFNCDITGLSYKTAYTFKVYATNAAGNGSPSASSNSVTLSLDQNITFSALSNVSYSSGSRTLDAYTSSGLAVTYSASGPCTASSTILTYTGVGTCSVTAIQTGSGSNYNAAESVTQSFTISAVQPDALTLTSLTPGASQLSATWTTATGLGGSTITGYVLSWAKRADFSDETSKSVLTTSSTISGLDPSTTYRVRVKVITNDYSDGSPWSNVLYATTFGLPDSPTVTGATSPAAGSVTVTWTDVPDANSGGTPIIGYTAEAFNASTGSSSGKTCTAGTSNCTITGLSGAISYYFKVTSTNAVGSSTSARYPNATSVQPGASQVITSVSPTVYHSIKSFYLETATTTSGLPIQFSKISETRTDSTTALSRTVCTINASSGLITVDLAGTCVIALDQDGTDANGNATSYLSASRVYETITVLANVASAPLDVAVNQGDTTLLISWSTPEDDGGVSITGYLLSWYKTSAGRPLESTFNSFNASSSSYDPSGRLSLSESSKAGYTVNKLINGTTYTIFIQAINSAGNGDESL
jgi:titin